MRDNPADASEQHTDGRTGARRRSPRSGMVLAALLTAALIAFVVQNDERVPVSWLLLSWEGPLWAVIVIAALAGALFSQVLRWVLRVARRRGR